jgi:hypothetical protein
VSAGRRPPGRAVNMRRNTPGAVTPAGRTGPERPAGEPDSSAPSPALADKDKRVDQFREECDRNAVPVRFRDRDTGRYRSGRDPGRSPIRGGREIPCRRQVQTPPISAPDGPCGLHHVRLPVNPYVDVELIPPVRAGGIGLPLEKPRVRRRPVFPGESRTRTPLWTWRPGTASRFRVAGRSCPQRCPRRAWCGPRPEHRPRPARRPLPTRVPPCARTRPARRDGRAAGVRPGGRDELLPRAGRLRQRWGRRAVRGGSRSTR